jgi:hypothetical protein
LRGEDPEIDIMPFLFTKYKKSKIEDDVIDKEIQNHEESIILDAIENEEPIKTYKIKQNDQYNIIVQTPKYPLEAAERKIVEGIVETRKMDYEDISLTKTDQIYIPKWSIVIETSGLTYKRESIACTKDIFRDEIDLCPKDSDKDVRKTYAICEMCGLAVCSKHIKNENSRFFCSNHENFQTSNLKIPHIDVNDLKDNVQTLLSEKIFHRKKKENNEIQFTTLMKEEEEEKEKTANTKKNSSNQNDSKNNSFGAPLK